MNERIREIADRTTAALEKLVPGDSGWWVMALAIVTALIAASIAAWAGWRPLRHQKESLKLRRKRAGSMLKSDRKADAASEWWRRIQWALKATTSENPVMYGYGMKMLDVLATSEVARSEEKAMLDAVWKGSVTGMTDEGIEVLVEDANKLNDSSQAQETSLNSVETGQDVLSSDLGAEPTYHRGYDPTQEDQVLSTLRREILAARLKVTLDEQLGRGTAPAVRRLAGMKLPPN
ncbi:hypothetical protein E2F48_11475 [Arthrobacter crusticola]|uniref:Uncharacterized protein n=1 Tax=Arthrobacter crusticola TaxID=2547960 RepID=A0A4R5TXB7_9MICC|nr:hypothetical protein [Arthrobacter crusticola]TDK25836.1 hypothetical protein E2F48_11475 [Arthrobacter crusticola]